MQWIVGIDEVGRGPLAGPVCVCAVALPAVLYRTTRWKKGLPILTDSKKMPAAARTVWEHRARILARDGTLRIGISYRSATHIDTHGIAHSIRAALASALAQLDIDPVDCTVFLDGGLHAPLLYKKQQTVIKGDVIHPIISLASVVAKVRRDALMRRLHQKHPLYAWEQNKGYGTRAHYRALRRHGHTPLHRKSFLSNGF